MDLRFADADTLSRMEMLPGEFDIASGYMTSLAALAKQLEKVKAGDLEAFSQRMGEFLADQNRRVLRVWRTMNETADLFTAARFEICKLTGEPLIATVGQAVGSSLHAAAWMEVVGDLNVLYVSIIHEIEMDLPNLLPDLLSNPNSEFSPEFFAVCVPRCRRIIQQWAKEFRKRRLQRAAGAALAAERVQAFLLRDRVPLAQIKNDLSPINRAKAAVQALSTGDWIRSSPMSKPEAGRKLYPDRYKGKNKGPAAAAAIDRLMKSGGIRFEKCGSKFRFAVEDIAPNGRAAK